MSNHHIRLQKPNKHPEIYVKPSVPYVMALYVKILISWLVAFEIISFELAEYVSHRLGLRNV